MSWASALFVADATTTVERVGTLEWPTLVVQALAAAGTIAVAVLAIWGDRFRCKPRLQLELVDEVGTLTHDNDRRQGRYYKLRVTNGRSWAPARNTRVVLRSVHKPAANGALVPFPVSGPLQLTWQWLVPQYPTLGAGEETCTFAHLIQGEPRLAISVYNPVPNNFPGFLGANERMVIEVAAVCDVAESPPLFLEISWNGRWSDDTSEMRTNVVIKNAGGRMPGSSLLAIPAKSNE
jgi:hypothetical protein